MNVKTVQWNIGGGKIRNIGSDPLEDSSYCQEGLEYVIKVLEGYGPDIVTLQETHADDKSVQADFISKSLGLPYYRNDVYDQSHVDNNYQLGQAVISRFPTSNHVFKFFYNPKYKLEQPDGSVWTSHNKGVTTCTLELGDKMLVVQTLHMIPFGRFGVNILDEDSKMVRDDLRGKIWRDAPVYLLQGDFNYNDKSVKDFLPDIFMAGLEDVYLNDPTTPKGKNLDHVLHRGMQLLRVKVLIEALTDHYPVLMEFKI